MFTDKLFTGHREIAGLGIYHYNHYNAQFHSPYINQFISADTIVPDPTNPQDLNRFSYVRNNPLKYTDPSGHDPWWCQSSSCVQSYSNSMANAPSQSGNRNSDDDNNENNSSGNGGCVLHPGQWICDLDAVTQESSHHYTISNVVCPASWNCSQEQMIYYLSLFAYPGQDPLHGPVLPTEFYSVSPPFGWFPEGSHPNSLGLIQVITSNGGLTSINITQPSHFFCCGQVERTVEQDSSGAWTVTTVGSGSNSSALSASLNTAVGPMLFNEMDTLMLIYIMEQKFPEPFPVPQD